MREYRGGVAHQRPNQEEMEICRIGESPAWLLGSEKGHEWYYSVVDPEKEKRMRPSEEQVASRWSTSDVELV